MRESKRALMPLPPTDVPVGYKCIQLLVPNDPPEFRQAFLGAILGLTYWFAWDRDEQRRGKEVARQFVPVFDSAFEQMNGIGDCDNVEFRQNGCNLEFKVGGLWQIIYTLSPECVGEKLQQATDNGIYSPAPRGAGDSRGVSPSDEQATLQNDLDKVWGGCLELTESVFDLCKIICDILEAGGDALSALGGLLESPVSSVTEWVADDITGAQKNWSTTGQSKWDTTGGVRTYERTITDPIRAISPAKLLSFFQRAIDIGVAILRNSFNEDFQEIVAGVLFNNLTCLPNGNRKEANIVLTTQILGEFGQELIDDVDLIKKFVGLAIKADELVDSIGFLSILNLPDLFRQYRVGTLQPSNSWSVLVDPCAPPETEWTVTLDLGQTDALGFEGLDTTTRLINASFGGWISGFSTSPANERLDVRRVFSQPTTIIRYRVFVNANAVFLMNGSVLNSALERVETQSFGQKDYTSEWTNYYELDSQAYGLYIAGVQTQLPVTGASQLRAQFVEIQGRGYNPFA